MYIVRSIFKLRSRFYTQSRSLINSTYFNNNSSISNYLIETGQNYPDHQVTKKIVFNFSTQNDKKPMNTNHLKPKQAQNRRRKIFRSLSQLIKNQEQNQNQKISFIQESIEKFQQKFSPQNISQLKDITESCFELISQNKNLLSKRGIYESTKLKALVNYIHLCIFKKQFQKFLVAIEEAQKLQKETPKQFLNLKTQIELLGHKAFMFHLQKNTDYRKVIQIRNQSRKLILENQKNILAKFTQIYYLNNLILKDEQLMDSNTPIPLKNVKHILQNRIQYIQDILNIIQQIDQIPERKLCAENNLKIPINQYYLLLKLQTGKDLYLVIAKYCNLIIKLIENSENILKNEVKQIKKGNFTGDKNIQNLILNCLDLKKYLENFLSYNQKKNH